MQNVTELDMKIFQHNGVFYDPMECSHKLQKMLKGRAETVLDDYFSDQPERSLSVYDQVKEAACVAFGFAMFDSTTGAGTHHEVWEGALEAYLDFFRILDASTATSQTAVPPTESLASSPAA